jgi:hypothetical protein
MRIARSFNWGFDAIKMRKSRRDGGISRNGFVCRPCGLFSDAPSERRRLARNWMAK